MIKAQNVHELTPPSTKWRHYMQCLAGLLPAEVLAGRDADRLVGELWTQGWTDAQISVHTKWSETVVARKRERMELPPHLNDVEVA